MSDAKKTISELSVLAKGSETNDDLIWVSHKNGNAFESMAMALSAVGSGGGGGGGLWAGGNLTFNLTIWNSYPENAAGFLLLVKSDGSTQRVTWSGSAPSPGPYPNVCLA